MIEENEICGCCKQSIDPEETAKFTATVVDKKTGKDETVNFCGKCAIEIMKISLSEGL